MPAAPSPIIQPSPSQLRTADPIPNSTTASNVSDQEPNVLAPATQDQENVCEDAAAEAVIVGDNDKNRNKSLGESLDSEHALPTCSQTQDNADAHTEAHKHTTDSVYFLNPSHP